MNVAELKNKLSGNEDLIYKVLDSAEFLEIRKNGNEFRCKWGEGHTAGGVQVKIESLKAVSYSTNENGDIITLIQKKLNMDFKNAFKWICSTLGFSTSFSKKKDIILPFGGFWKKLSTEHEDDDYKIYNMSELKEFGNTPNRKFLKDEISIQTQRFFNIGYDVGTNRFTVPWFDQFGNLVGVMGRYNGDYEKDGVAKWFPVLDFKKANFVYGFYQNYSNILKKDIIVIGESEKNSLVLNSWNLPVGIGLGGNYCTPNRASLIKATRVGTIITALDEGLDEEYSQKIAIMLKSDNEFYRNQSGYIFDRKNKYLPKDSKMSIYDLGYETFKKIMCDSDCIVWV